VHNVAGAESFAASVCAEEQGLVVRPFQTAERTPERSTRALSPAATRRRRPGSGRSALVCGLPLSPFRSCDSHRLPRGWRL